MTEKLYYLDSHIFDFTATVTGSRDGWLTLDRTAFFPGGGGQSFDTGVIGGKRVAEVKESGEDVLHFTGCDIPVGTVVECALDREPRLRRMQCHTAEHIICGIAHEMFGYDNVGFHMTDCVTFDLSGELTRSELEEIETRANKVVRDNVKVTAYFPESTEGLIYRSKQDFADKLRIVEIEGVDRCACCVPHVKSTGEIGLIKIISADRHRGGMRINMTAGLDALDYVRLMQKNITEISMSLSAPREDTSAAVERLKEERDGLKLKISGLESKLVSALSGEGNCVFADLSDSAQRELCNMLMEKYEIAAVFSNGRYIIGSKSVDLKAKAAEINAAIGGRGGGKKEMIQGSYTADEKTVKEYFS